MAVTAGMVKELREITGAGMVDCKNALVQTDGDLEKAIEALREKGLAAAAKKAGRIASEGLVHAYITDDNKKGVVVEVNSETDFVAKNQDFKTFVDLVAKQAINSSNTEMDKFMAEAWIGDSNITVSDALNQKIAIIGENLSIRRFEKFEKGPGVLVSYIHGGGRVAVLLEIASSVESDAIVEAGKNVCMQIAAMSPKFVSKDEISAEFIEKEREILTQQTINEGRDAATAQKIVEGRLAKELREFCLNDQEYVKDSKLTVSKYVQTLGADVKIKRFVRFETGEGLEKKEENFADEVSKVMQG